MRSLVLAVILVCIAAPAALAQSRASSELEVVATTTQLASITHVIGGNRIDVKSLLQPNVDPHTFEPRPSTVEASTEAALFVTSGVGLDSWFARVVATSGSGAPVFDASKGLTLRAGDAEEPAGDPHWWHDPRNVVIVSHNLAAALTKIDPKGKAVYANNARLFIARLQKLDADNARLINLIPKARRKLVTNHDAFGYFAARYGLRVVGTVLGSLSSSAKPNAKDTAALITKIRREHVPAIFTESSINPKLERQIASEAGVKVYANLYGDTLGPKGSPGATYLQMEHWNALVISYGLRGKPIPKP